jgi:hypothetical protein
VEQFDLEEQRGRNLQSTHLRVLSRQNQMDKIYDGICPIWRICGVLHLNLFLRQPHDVSCLGHAVLFPLSIYENDQIYLIDQG